MPVRDELVQLTKELVAIPSVSDDPAERSAVIDFIERFCAELPGVHTARYESDGKPSLVQPESSLHRVCNDTGKRRRDR